MAKAAAPKKPSAIALDAIHESFGDNIPLFNFYIKWVEHGFNATEAYAELHPEVTYGSARTLGAKMLAKIDRSLIMEAYGMGQDYYFKSIYGGSQATKLEDLNGERVPDWKTRKPYLDDIGTMLKIKDDDFSEELIIGWRKK